MHCEHCLNVEIESKSTRLLEVNAPGTDRDRSKIELCDTCFEALYGPDADGLYLSKKAHSGQVFRVVLHYPHNL